MKTSDHGNIYSTGNSCRDTSKRNMALKLLQYFCLLMEKPLDSYFEIWIPYYQVAQCNQKTPTLYPQGDRSGLRNPSKDKNQH